MRSSQPVCRDRKPRGVALLIAIFALLLISAAAISLILMAGTESAIEANYRTSTQAFYAAYAGLEEARGRMWAGNPNAFGSFIVPAGTTLAVGQARYVLNPSAGEVVNPTNLAADNPYADTEYQKEWGVPVTSAVVQTTASTSAIAGLAGPLYKWVRITPKTEKSSGLDVNGDGVLDNTTPLFYDGSAQDLSSLGGQVFTLTSLAVLPNGSRRMLQYDVSAVGIILNLPAALTMNSSEPEFTGPNSAVFHVDGHDHSPGPGAGCPVPQAPRPGIGVITDPGVPEVISGIPVNRLLNYTGSTPAPSVSNVAANLPSNMQTPAALQSLLNQLQSLATDVVQGDASSLPNYGSPNSPVIEFVKGDLELKGNATGYGILVVTGEFEAAGTVSWHGIVLVVGEGEMEVEGGGNGGISGALLVAQIYAEDSGNLLPALGEAEAEFEGGGNSGVLYNSCDINRATVNSSDRALAFREISQ